MKSKMSRIRRGYELEQLFWGRAVRPFHLAVTLATSVIAASNLTNNEVTFLGNVTSNTIGALALTSAVLLTIGWWKQNDWAAEWGLLLAVGVWVSRAVYIALTEQNLFLVGTVASCILSMAWAIGAGGAYLLERYDHEVSVGDGE